MNEPTNKQHSDGELTSVVATATLRDALQSLRVPEQTVMILAGFRATASSRDVLGTGWSL